MESLERLLDALVSCQVTRYLRGSSDGAAGPPAPLLNMAGLSWIENASLVTASTGLTRLLVKTHAHCARGLELFSGVLFPLAPQLFSVTSSWRQDRTESWQGEGGEGDINSHVNLPL